MVSTGEERDLPVSTDEGTRFKTARFAVNLNLPPADASLLEDAQKAIRSEHRDSARWKRLCCRKVTKSPDAEAGTVFELQVGHAVELDWTWEGAVAFRPLSLTRFEGDSGDPDIDDSVVWAGELLEVDEASGRIFVATTDPKHPPRRGSFYVKPFEYLAVLNAVFNEPAFSLVRNRLPSRLAAAQGGVHPDACGVAAAGLDHLKHWWRKSWSILWGPPGTGKTYTTGQQVAGVLEDDPTERILVVSTTNRATDAAAVSVGRAALPRNVGLREGRLLRIGKGASLKRFEEEHLGDMLRGTETEYLAKIEELNKRLSQTIELEQKALIRKEIKAVREVMHDASKRSFLDEQMRVVISIAFKATTTLACDEVKDLLEQGHCPFTTIIIDEAGLLSRPAIAALSLLASRRVVLVGDSKQLAPISRISRILEPVQGKWLAKSGLSHLDQFDHEVDGVQVLVEQRRMHLEICEMVSAYQYNGLLATAEEVTMREYELPSVLEGHPRVIWCVLDEATDDIPAIRADRGAGNRSWVRKATIKVLDRLFSNLTLRKADGLFITPFKAQAKRVNQVFAANNMGSWMASTVHSQQGAEADIVIFDTVNAGSHAWPYDEWMRLVNVALSRARESIIVLASRAEMNEPYLRPLAQHLWPAVLRWGGSRWTWQEVQAEIGYAEPTDNKHEPWDSLGAQISRRKALRPVLSHEQERLIRLELDGKPRLVRGVAGSGKTVVLAHWLVQTVHRLEDPNARIWAVFANRSLQSQISDTIQTAWDRKEPFPWGRVGLHHVLEILVELLRSVWLSMKAYGFDYDGAAKAYLERVPIEEISPRCDALFIDEAQDMGPSTLKLLFALARQSDNADENSRAVHIFYDNAQNIYGRGTPTWSDLGLDLRGRSSVMKDSFRSTRPITELALNILYRLQPPDTNPDHKELVARGLIEPTRRNESAWWRVRFNQVDGPRIQFRRFMSLDEEFAAIAAYCRELITEQCVSPSDICLIYNGKNIKHRIEQQVAPALADLGVEVSVQTNKPFVRSKNTLLATTAQSFKGFDSEIVIIPAVDQFTARGKGVLANSLYVAMTRARSMLVLFSQQMKNADAQQLYEVIEGCLDCLEERPDVERDASPQDGFHEILDQIGHEHHRWLLELWRTHNIKQEPLTTKKGEIIVDPLISVYANEKYHVCFGKEPPSQRTLRRIEDFGIKLLEPGQNIEQ
jgi:superfamily I DNA/RNA helicase